MPKKIRDYLFILFVLIFIIGTGLMSLYASGYQINLSWPPTFNRWLIKTGMIAIKTNPEGATVYLNGRPQANFSLNPWKTEYLTTATKVKNVLPGDYDLSLKLPGYLTLTKKISVYSGETTFVENINLFRSNLPQFIASAARSDLKLSASRNYLYSSALPGIIAVASGQETKLPIPIGSAGTWRQNSDQLLAGGRLFSASGKITSDYQELLGAGAENWYYEASQNRLYYQNGNSLNYFDLNSQASTLVVGGENILAYEPRGDNLFIVAVENGQTVLQVYSLSTQKIGPETTLPTVGHYVFSDQNRAWLTLYDDQNKTLYLINPADIGGGGKTIQNVLSWQWLNDQTLFYNNSWEIYSWDANSGNTSLLVRVGEKISQIAWNQNNNYLIFSSATGLNAYDPKAGLITKIFTADEVAAPVLDNNSDILYFWAKLGHQAGVYSLLLQ